MSTYTPQTSVTDRPVKTQGLANDFKPINTSPRIADGATPIDPGMAVIGAAGDDEVTLPSAVFTYAAFEGVVINSLMSKEKSLLSGDKSFVAGDPLTVIKDGEVDVLLGGDVTEGDDLFFVHTAGGASPIHTFRADLDTDKASPVPAIALETQVAGQLATIHVSYGAKISKVIT